MPIQVEKFSHIAMQVSNLEESIAFYRDLLGLEMVMETKPEDFPEGGPKVHVVGCLVGGNVVIEFGEGLGPPGPVETKGAPVLALSVADIHATHEALLEAGVEPTMPPTEMMPGLFMIFIKDPDGRTIEFAQFPDGALSSAEYNAREHRSG
jgi:lactoylglutathione lyase